MGLKIDEKLKYFISICFGIFIILFCISAVSANIYLGILCILYIFVILFIIKKVIPLNIKEVLQRNLFKIVLVLFIIGIILHISLLFIDYNKPQSDYKAFYDNAVSFAEKTKVDSNYIALFPHLAVYIMTIGSIMKVFGTSYYIVVIVNVILDIGCSILIYCILKNITNNKLKGILGASLWIINPINIIWSAMVVPITFFAFSFLISIFVFYKTLDNIKKKTFFAWSILLGIIIGIANMYRPIMLIFLIAIFIMYFFKAIKEKEYVRIIIGMAITVVVFVILGKIEYIGVKSLIKKEPSSALPGYNIYVGSNMPTGGVWSSRISGELFEKYEALEFDPNKTQEYFAQKGIQTYKENGSENISFLADKFHLLTSDIPAITIYTFKIHVKITPIFIIDKISFWVYIALYSILFLNIIFSYRNIREKETDLKVIVLQLFLIGFFISSVFLEIAARYALPLIVPLTILAVVNKKSIVNDKLLT